MLRAAGLPQNPPIVVLVLRVDFSYSHCMASKPLNVASMLRAAFRKPELIYLNTQPAFQTELEKVKTPEEFEKLCMIGEKLLRKQDEQRR